MSATSSHRTALASTTSVAPRNEAGSADRFLKLLVAQMQSQDPLNPMDNAQITSQMAQINTVNGIEQAQHDGRGPEPRSSCRCRRCRAPRWSGHDVTLKGDQPRRGATAAGVGGFELSAPADRVKVEILAPAGHVVDTLDLGAQGAGGHGFSWAAPATCPTTRPTRFRVVATAGAIAVPATPLMRDRVEAVSTVGDRLMLETARTAAASPTATSRPSTDPTPSTASRDTTRTIHELPARPLGAERHRPEPGDHRQQHRQCQHLRHQGVARRVRRRVRRGAERCRRPRPSASATTLAAVAQQFTQGNITTTENPMDLAINGAGFFQVTDGKNPAMFTRNGQFKVDRDGYIVNNARLRLMGYRADEHGHHPAGPGRGAAAADRAASSPSPTTRDRCSR